MDAAWFTSLTAFALAMSATPGPNNMMLASSGANFGWRASVPHMLGVWLGMPMALVVLGAVGLPVIRQPTVHGALKLVGTAYLLWLAWRIARTETIPLSGGNGGGEAGAGAAHPDGSRPLSFVQAALFQWVNPKIWVAAAGALVAFALPGGGVVGSVAWMAAIFSAIAVPVMLFWTLLGVGAARLLTSPGKMRLFNWTMASLLVASLVPTLRM